VTYKKVKRRSGYQPDAHRRYRAATNAVTLVA